MPTIEELTEMVKNAGGDPLKLNEAATAALAELNGAQGALHNANKEAADRRKKLEAFEKAEADKANAEKTELEKEKARAAELEKKLSEQSENSRKTTIRHAVEMTAAKLGFTDPADAYTLADLAGIKVGDDGKVEGVEKVLEDLLKKKPYLKGQSSGKHDIDADKRNTATGVSKEELLERKRAAYGGM